MAETSFAEQVATFNAALEAIEIRVASGEVGRETVADFKSGVSVEPLSQASKRLQ